MPKDKVEVEEVLVEWNSARHAIVKFEKEIIELSARIARQREIMEVSQYALEDMLFNLVEPIGLKIDDDYVVVVQNPQNDSFVIQTVNFDLREEIKGCRVT